MKNPRPFGRLLSHLMPAVSLSLCALGAAQAQTPGAQDFTFASGPEADSTVLALALQPNGQVLAGGLFANFRGQARSGVARLNPDGTLDSFNPGLVLSGYNGGAPSVNAIAIQADGQIIVAGSFNVLGQTAGVGIARLNAADGSLDNTFNAGSGALDNGGAVGAVYSLAVLPNHQILVGGDFLTFNGSPYTGLVRLNPNGAVDTTFNPGGSGVATNGYGHYVQSIALQSNGQIIIGGGFDAYNGFAEGSVARLNADGTPDQGFKSGPGADEAVFTVAVQSNGQVLAGGNFNNFDGASIATHLVRLNTDGTLDTSYYDPNFNLFITEVDSIVLQPDGEAIIGGNFLSQGGLVNGQHNGVARVQTDGSQDTSFDSGDNDNGETDAGQAYALALQPNGEIIEASDFGGGTFPSDVFRLYATGAAVPVVTSATASAQVGTSFSFQIVASNSPSSYGATGLPSGLSVDTSTGLISGTPTQSGSFTVALTATNLAGPGTGALSLTVAPEPLPLVTITPGVTETLENSGSPATFVVTLSSALPANVKIAYKVKGSGVNGVDFDYLPGKLKIKKGHTTGVIDITPIDRGISGGRKVTVKLVLTAGTTYALGSPGVAKVKIVDGD